MSAAVPGSAGEGDDDDDEGDRMEDRSEPGGSDSALRNGFFLPLAGLVVPSPPRAPGAGDLSGASSLRAFLQLCILLHLFPALFSGGSPRAPPVCQVYVFNKLPSSARSPPLSSSCVTSFSISARASVSDSLSVPMDEVMK